MSLRTHLALALSLFGSLALASCDDNAPEIHVEGELSYPSCGEVLPWEPVFAAYTEDPFGAGLIRFQSEPGPLQDQDQLVIALPNAALVRASTGVALPVATEDADAIHLSFDFRSSCPGSTLSTVSSGWIRFDQFSGDFDTPAQGEFLVSVFDARTGELVAESVHGDFLFTIERYRPYQSFN